MTVFESLKGKVIVTKTHPNIFAWLNLVNRFSHETRKSWPIDTSVSLDMLIETGSAEYDTDLEVAMDKLFLDENYERHDYKYKDLEQPLYALQDASNY